MGSDRQIAEPSVRYPGVRGALASVAVLGLLAAGCGTSGHKSTSTATAASTATTPARIASTPTTPPRHHVAHPAHGVRGRPTLPLHSIGATSPPTGSRQRAIRASNAATAAAMASAGKPGSKFCKLNVGGRTILVSCQAEATVLAQERHSDQMLSKLRAGRRGH